MIHAIIEDDIKGKYIRQNETLSRLELDSLKSKNCPVVDVYEMIADQWNSTTFNPVTQVSDVHQDFKTSIDCFHKFVQHLSPATPQKIRDKISFIRKELFWIIDNWQKSGHGE